jgi:hypothetical protein
MKKIYIVLQSKESKKLLLVQDEHGRLSLPCHKHWPVVKAVPQKKWNESLVRHITYGLLDVPSVNQPRPFGLDHEAAFYLGSHDNLEALIEQCNSVRKWNKFNAMYTSPWTLKLYDCKEIPNTIDANSAACIQVCSQ